MNCIQFMYSLDLEMKVSISVVTPFFSCTGDAVIVQGEYGTTRDMYCGRSTRLHRLGPFCTRFKLSSQDFDSSGLSDGVFGLLNVPTQPRPWDEEDPFYPRAVAVWDAQVANKKSQGFFLNVGIYNLGGTFAEWKNGEVADVYGGGFDPLGTATLTIRSL
jgi:hypothetical protein